jgi:hypothetical protein
MTDKFLSSTFGRRTLWYPTLPNSPIACGFGLQKWEVFVIFTILFSTLGIVDFDVALPRNFSDFAIIACN